MVHYRSCFFSRGISILLLFQIRNLNDDCTAASRALNLCVVFKLPAHYQMDRDEGFALWTPNIRLVNHG